MKQWYVFVIVIALALLVPASVAVVAALLLLKSAKTGIVRIIQLTAALYRDQDLFQDISNHKYQY